MLKKTVDKDGKVTYTYSRGRGKGYATHTTPHTEESKKKSSESAKLMWQRESHNRKMNDYRRKQNHIVITNGVDNKHLLCGEPIPEGWWRGRVYKKPMAEITARFLLSNHFPHHTKLNYQGRRENEFNSEEG